MVKKIIMVKGIPENELKKLSLKDMIYLFNKLKEQ